MTFQCKGACEFHKSEGIPTNLIYQMGQKRCSLCEIFLETSNLRCPCCNSKLRTKARRSKNKI